MQIERNCFFASANSGRGFINRFPEIFHSPEYLYIIKGGSGTGKSSFMKKAAKIAESKGYTAEYCLCSSDPDSLDGLKIPELNIGFIDGTAPHTADPKYPGAYDEIINMGDFWKGEMLIDEREMIKKITNLKSSLYRLVYRYLGSAYELLCAQKELLLPCFEQNKAERCIERIFRNIDTSHKGNAEIRCIEAITMKGIIRLSYDEAYERIYSLKDRYGIACRFLELIENKLIKLGCAYTKGYSALDPDMINMIAIPSQNILFSIDSACPTAITLNMDRFINKDIFHGLSKDIKALKKHKNILISEAVSVLERTGRAHFELEKIYINTMDFKAKELYEKQLLTKIFGPY